MRKNFLKLTWRNLLRNRVYSIISILGLAFGISSCLLIALYVNDELSYDDFHEKGDRIYRLTNELHFNGSFNAALSDLPSGPTILSEYPEVENYVRFRSAGQTIEMRVGDRIFNQANVWFTDSTIFDVFSYPLISGDPSNALNSPNSIVLTATLAKKLFGEEDAQGQSLKLNNSLLTVTAVMHDPPNNSDIKIEALISINTLPPSFHQTFNQDWFRIGFYTFLLFEKPVDIAEFEEKMVAFEKKYVQPWSAENQIEAGLVYHITPLKEVHFQQGLDYDFPKGNIHYIWIFSLLAIFILVIASINYVNLSLAQSSKRAKEVGVRKTLGAFRKELIIQFISESIIIAILATIIGLMIIELSIGTFNNTTRKSFTVLAVFQPTILITMGCIIVLIGFLAGSYPALVLSRFEPVKVLKGVMVKQGGVGSLQKTLILVQFVFSLFMITGTILINDQMNFLRSMNLGFDKENIISISLPADTAVNKRLIPWTEELRNDANIAAVSLTNLPTGNTGEIMFRIEKDGQMQEQTVRTLFIDENFIDVLGLEILEGRNFDPEINTDQQQAFIVNSHAAKSFGWGDEALNKRVQWGILPNGGAHNDGKVVGVVNDFHFLSLHNPMEPIIICFNPSGNNTMSIKFAKGDFTSTLESLENEWRKLAPNHPFEFQFFDEALEQNYQQEAAMGTIFKYFALISVIIAALGLFALVSFSIQSRIKEIGVRKVLGATVAQLAWLLIKDFILLLLVAFIITTPINIYLMNRWLEDFAYNVPINPMNFVIALLVGLALTGITISYHVYKIAKANPVDSLRYE